MDTYSMKEGKGEGMREWVRVKEGKTTDLNERKSSELGGTGVTM
jgi:hypothetical protein